MGYYLLGIIIAMKTIQDTAQLYLFETEVYSSDNG